MLKCNHSTPHPQVPWGEYMDISNETGIIAQSNLDSENIQI